MVTRTEKRWLLVAVGCWAAILALAVAGGYYIHQRAMAIVTHIVSQNPKPERQAVYKRLEGDRLVHEALARHEAATSGTAEAARETTAALIAGVRPLLEQAERLYLESSDLGTSPSAILFQLGEVNFLMGRRARGFLFLSRYWGAMGEKVLTEVYRRRAAELEPATSHSSAGEMISRDGK